MPQGNQRTETVLADRESHRPKSRHWGDFSNHTDDPKKSSGYIVQQIDYWTGVITQTREGKTEEQ